MVRGVISEKEKVSMSTARIKVHGHEFEISIDSSAAIKFRNGEADIREALKAFHVYKDAQKGELAGEVLLKECFDTDDELVVAAKIIKEGELHFDEEYRENLRSEKKNAIISILVKESADANTGEPVNQKRLLAAFSQGKVNVDLFKKPEDQIEDILKKLRPVIALTLERKTLQIRIASKDAAKLYGSIANKGRIISDSWLSDGSWSGRVELSAGQATLLIDELKKSTKGEAEISVEAKKK
jgi:rRNA metabolism SBDS family protein